MLGNVLAMFVTHAKMTYGMRSVDDNAEKFVLAVKVFSADSIVRYREGDFNENVYEVDLIIDGENPNLQNIILELGNLSEIWGQGMEEPLIAIENLHLNSKNILTPSLYKLSK